MAMLKVAKSEIELEREQLLRKAFASHNRKLKNMVESETSPEYVLNVARTFKMQDSDMDPAVMAYVQHLLKKEEAPAAEQPKSEKKKAEKKSEAKAESSQEPAAE